jgi:hypothetical protein
MISLSTVPVRFVPEIFDAADATAPAFWLRPGNVIERDMLEAELAGEYRAARVFGSDLARAFVDGVSTLLADDTEACAALLALHAAERELDRENAEAAKAKGEPLADEERRQLPAADRQLLAGAREQLTEHWPDYRSLIAQANRRTQILPLVAFRRFCTGWENIEEAAPFAVGPDKLVTLQAVGSIPFMLMKLAGRQAYGMLYGGGQAKNSPAPSKSGADQTTSTSD